MFSVRVNQATRGTVPAMRMFLLAAVVMGAAAACSTPTANVNATYDVTLTQGSDGCGVATAMEGVATTGSTLAFVQTGGDLQATLGGTNAMMLKTLVGNTVFTGTIDGDGIQMTISGEFTRMIDDCNYILDAVVTATASSDGATLFGSLSYREVSSDASCVVTNDAGSATTGAVACTTDLSLSGTRE
jgi:hypothetical protein